MSTLQMSDLGSRRLSKRRKIKTQKVIDQYQIINPYKRTNQKTVIPDELNKQLRKLQFLSKTNLELIKLKKQDDPQNENLNRMRKASNQQEEKYLDYLKIYPSCRGELSNTDSKNNRIKGLSIVGDKISCKKTNIESLDYLKDEPFLEPFQQNLSHEQNQSNLSIQIQANSQHEEDIFADNYQRNYLPSIDHEHCDNIESNIHPRQNHQDHYMHHEDQLENMKMELEIEGDANQCSNAQNSNEAAVNSTTKNDDMEMLLF